MTFWDHLDALRSVLLRGLAAACICGVAAFALKDQLFALLLAPTHADFLLYRLLGADEDFRLHLVNTGLSEQFMAHLSISAYAGCLAASPYLLYLLFSFVAPGLYQQERQIGRRLVGGAYAMFLLGAALNYCLVFPLAVRFLGSYQVSGDVEVLLSLQSYLDTFLTLSLAMGLVFQLPVVCLLLSRAGLLSASLLRRYRRHAFVGILTMAAIITPTVDPFTLFAVALPIYLLYEVSCWIIRT